MATTNPWDEFHAAWRRVEATLRSQTGQVALRGPIVDVIQGLVRTGRLTEQVAAELDAYRRLRNIDSHEGIAGTGQRLCTPTAEAVQRLEDLASQLECPLAARQVMSKAPTCSGSAPISDALTKLRDGATVVYYREGKRWFAFDRGQMSRIVERAARGSTTTIDLTRSVADHVKKIGELEVAVLPGSATAKQAVQAVRALAAAEERFPAVLVLDGRSVYHMTAKDVPDVERRIVL